MYLTFLFYLNKDDVSGSAGLLVGCHQSILAVISALLVYLLWGHSVKSQSDDSLRSKSKVIVCAAMNVLDNLYSYTSSLLNVDYL